VETIHANPRECQQQRARTTCSCISEVLIDLVSPPSHRPSPVGGRRNSRGYPRVRVRRNTGTTTPSVCACALAINTEITMRRPAAIFRREPCRTPAPPVRVWARVFIGEGATGERDGEREVGMLGCHVRGGNTHSLNDSRGELSRPTLSSAASPLHSHLQTQAHADGLRSGGVGRMHCAFGGYVLTMVCAVMRVLVAMSREGRCCGGGRDTSRRSARRSNARVDPEPINSACGALSGGITKL
jgi:hypothetical protein